MGMGLEASRARALNESLLMVGGLPVDRGLVVRTGARLLLDWTGVLPGPLSVRTLRGPGTGTARLLSCSARYPPRCLRRARSASGGSARRVGLVGWPGRPNHPRQSRLRASSSPGHSAITRSLARRATLALEQFTWTACLRCTSSAQSHHGRRTIHFPVRPCS